MKRLTFSHRTALLLLLVFCCSLFANASYTFWYKGICYVHTGNNTVTVTNAGNSQYSGEIIIPSVVKATSISYDVSEYPLKVTSIGEDAFRDCAGVTRVTIPNSVTSIGKNAFYGCTGLSAINIPNSVTSIGTTAFGYCSSLKSIYIPSSLKKPGRQCVLQLYQPQQRHPTPDNYRT